jgi:hypothetical protein
MRNYLVMHVSLNYKMCQEQEVSSTVFFHVFQEAYMQDYLDYLPYSCFVTELDKTKGD